MNDKSQFESRLSQALKEWTDIDVAAFHLAVALGIAPPSSDETEPYNFAGKKWIFWTENPLGNMLFNLLENMAALNILEKHENDESLYWWNKAYEWEDFV